MLWSVIAANWFDRLKASCILNLLTIFRWQHFHENCFFWFAVKKVKRKRKAKSSNSADSSAESSRDEDKEKRKKKKKKQKKKKKSG